MTAIKFIPNLQFINQLNEFVSTFLEEGPAIEIFNLILSFHPLYGNTVYFLNLFVNKERKQVNHFVSRKNSSFCWWGRRGGKMDVSSCFSTILQVCNLFYTPRQLKCDTTQDAINVSVL